jgi:hypothetical protein
MGTAGVAGAVVVASPGGEEEVSVQATAPASVSAPPGPTVQATEPSPTSSATAGTILTYTHPVYGYSFQYPSDWFVHSSQGMTIVTSWDTTKAPGIGGPIGDGFKIDISVIENTEGLTLDDWIEKFATGTTDAPTVLSQSPFVLDGKQGMKRETVAEEERATEYFLLVGRSVVSIGAFPLDSPLAKTGLATLASFKFSE